MPFATSPFYYTPPVAPPSGGGGSPMRDWAGSTAYAVGDLVRAVMFGPNPKILLYCTAAHTSLAGGILQMADAVNWDYIGQDIIATTYSNGAVCPKNLLYQHTDGVLYKRTALGTSGPSGFDTTEQALWTVTTGTFLPQGSTTVTATATGTVAFNKVNLGTVPANATQLPVPQVWSLPAANPTTDGVWFSVKDAASSCGLLTPIDVSFANGVKVDGSNPGAGNNYTFRASEPGASLMFVWNLAQATWVLQT